MKTLVIGSTGATGVRAVAELLARGHQVTAFARTPDKLQLRHENLTIVQGNVMNQADVDAAVAGHDAVVVTLGITENPLMVRLRGAKGTETAVRSEGTANVVRAMQRAGVERLVVQTTYGIGQTKGTLPLKWKMIFSLLLAPQIRDTERQESIVRDSALTWSLVQPVGLTDDDGPEGRIVSTEGTVPNMVVSRRNVAGLLADCIEQPAYACKSVAVCAA